MHRTVLLLVALLLAGCAARAPVRWGDWTALVVSEHAFARSAAERGTREAFLTFLADDSVVFRPGPVDGKAAYAGRPASPGLLSWEPVRAEMAAACDLGYTTGPWEYRKDRSDPEAAAHGQYVSVWRRLPDGTWRVAVDVGVGHGKPKARAAALVPPFKPQGDCAEPARGEDVQREGASLRRAEEDLARRTAGEGEAALLSVLDRDVRLLRDGRFPALGLEAARKALAGQAEPASFAAAGSEVSRSGDLGYAYGTSKRGRPGAETAHSAFLRIWRRGADGRWLVVLDLASPIPPPGA